MNISIVGAAGEVGRALALSFCVAACSGLPIGYSLSATGTRLASASCSPNEPTSLMPSTRLRPRSKSPANQRR